MARRPKERAITDSAIEAALIASGGVLKDAAAIIGCNQNTVRQRINKNPHLFKVEIESDTRTGAKAVENIKTAIDQGDVKTSQWWCNNRMHAFFSPRQEVTGASGLPISIDLTATMTEEQIDAAISRATAHANATHPFAAQGGEAQAAGTA